MWPWEHVAVGYLLYSLWLRALGREPPAERDTAVLVAATLLPDLVDKPLAWGAGLFPSGFAVAHSAFVAVPLGLAALALGRQYDRRRVGVAFLVGYWSHLLGDVLNPIRAGGRPVVVRVLWPVVETAPYDTDYGLGRGLVYLREFFATVPRADPLDILLLYVLVPAATIALWALDGAPGTAWLRRLIGAVGRRIS